MSDNSPETLPGDAIEPWPDLPDGWEALDDVGLADLLRRFHGLGGDLHAAYEAHRSAARDLIEAALPFTEVDPGVIPLDGDDGLSIVGWVTDEAGDVVPLDDSGLVRLADNNAGTAGTSGTTRRRPADRASKLKGIPRRYADPDPGKIDQKPQPLRSDGDFGWCREDNPQTNGGDGVYCGKRHKLPARHIDYEGHADITLDLIAVDPLWTWKPAATTDGTKNGPPKITVQPPARTGDPNRLVMWGSLRVHGEWRRAVGTCRADQPEPEKELIGDLIRNGAMRFGIGTALWSKAERWEPEHEPPAPPAPPAEPPPVPDGFLSPAAAKDVILQAADGDPSRAALLWETAALEPVVDEVGTLYRLADLDAFIATLVGGDPSTDPTTDGVIIGHGEPPAPADDGLPADPEFDVDPPGADGPSDGPTLETMEPPPPG